MSEFTDWGLWANIVTVLMFVIVVGGGILAWLWRTGRWFFAPRLQEPEAPAAPETTHLIGLPDPVTVFGREDEVADIRARLQAAPGHNVALVNSGAVLAGQGGIGKTTLARYYVECHAADYSGVLWTLA
ncbi:MAG: ATP-binding protein, partial [Rhodobacteraceae bacterium]|nr:ATP-binding protein [Paracoccaceae bacterium]